MIEPKVNQPVFDARSLRLINASESAPPDLAEVLLELGAGDNRFSGTTFGRGECSLQAFLQSCRECEQGLNLLPNKVAQSTYWLVNDENRVVGIVRVRHQLNERLLQYGGHIGYYIRPSARSLGCGKAALRLGLVELRQLGVTRALLTVNPGNLHSVRVVLANSGVPEGQGKDPDTGEIVNRYWIELSEPPSTRS